MNQNAGGRDPNIEEDHVQDVHKRRPESTLLLQGACAMAMDNPERDGTPNRSPHIAEVKEHPSLTVDKLKIEATNEKDCDLPPSGIRRAGMYLGMLLKSSYEAQGVEKSHRLINTRIKGSSYHIA